MILVSSSEMSEVSLSKWPVGGFFLVTVASTASGFRPNLARSLLVSSIESESPRPPSGMGEGERTRRGGGGHLGTSEEVVVEEEVFRGGLVGGCFSIGKSRGTSTTSEPERNGKMKEEMVSKLRRN